MRERGGGGGREREKESRLLIQIIPITLPYEFTMPISSGAFSASVLPFLSVGSLRLLRERVAEIPINSAWSSFSLNRAFHRATETAFFSKCLTNSFWMPSEERPLSATLPPTGRPSETPLEYVSGEFKINLTLRHRIRFCVLSTCWPLAVSKRGSPKKIRCW